MNIKDEWLKGTAGHEKCITKCTDNNEINRFEWFVSACAKGVYFRTFDSSWSFRYSKK